MKKLFLAITLALVTSTTIFAADTSVEITHKEQRVTTVKIKPNSEFDIPEGWHVVDIEMAGDSTILIIVLEKN